MNPHVLRKANHDYHVGCSELTEEFLIFVTLLSRFIHTKAPGVQRLFDLGLLNDTSNDRERDYMYCREVPHSIALA